MKNLFEVNLSESERERVNTLINELERNNKKLLEPSKNFWDYLRRYLDDCINSNKVENLDDYLEKNTSFLIDNSKHTKKMDYSAYPINFPSDVFTKKNYPNLDEDYIEETIFYLQSSAGLKLDIANKCFDLMKRNSELITEICKIDVNKRLGNNYKGIYAYCGLDVDLIYKLGGKWLLIEPFDAQDYKKRLHSETKFGKKAVREGRMIISNLSFLDREIIPRYFKNVDPNVILIKCPTPGAKYYDLVNFYKKIINKDTLIISDIKLKDKNMLPINNITGKEGLKKLYSVQPLDFVGSFMYPVLNFQFYILKKD